MNLKTKQKMKRLANLFCFLILLAGCKGVETVSTSQTLRDSVVFREVEKPVIVPGYTLEGVRFNIDSLAAVIRAGVPAGTIERTLIKEDPETKARVKILIDELGNLTAVCEQQDRIIETLVQERDIYRTFTETIIQREKESLFKQIKDFLKYVVIFFGLLTIGFVAYKLLRR